MKKQFYMIGLVMVAGVFLAGCSRTSEPTSVEQKGEDTKVVTSNTAGSCTPGKVQIEGYGDPGKRLANCFVEYPGEPSRQDKSYYVVEDVCGQFTKEFIQNALGKPIVSIKPPEHDSLFNCRYYLDDKDDHVLLVFEYLSIDIQKKGNENMGRRTEVSDKIPMRNMLVWQENGILNNIYLVFDDEKFISIDRSSESTLTADELISFAENIAKEIKDYK